MDGWMASLCLQGCHSAEAAFMECVIVWVTADWQRIGDGLATPCILEGVTEPQKRRASRAGDAGAGLFLHMGSGLTVLQY